LDDVSAIREDPVLDPLAAEELLLVGVLVDAPVVLAESFEFEPPHAASMPSKAHKAPARPAVFVMASPSK
jgi:hypothetical protein